MNSFYTDFDNARCVTGQVSAKEDYRTAFQIDRDRIIHSSALRRLQAKTQVFQPGDYDFYRTRLTHSIEVAQIGRSICQYLNSGQADSPLNWEFAVDADLVEAICLSHDLGHPPFGHSGEEILNKLMKEYGGFEGNAQTVRIVTRRFYQRKDGFRGMSPTRAFLDGVMKYKSLYRECWDAGNGQPANHFLYDDQADLRDFVHDGHSTVPLSGDVSRSLESQIMDWADDTAYGLNDLSDGFHAGFITGDRIEQWASEHSKDEWFTPDSHELLKDLTETIRQQALEPFLGRKIGEFIRAVSIIERESHPLNGQSNRYRYSLCIAPQIEMEVKLYKKLAFALVFNRPEVEQLRYKGRFILTRLHQAVCDFYNSKRAPSRTRNEPELIPGPFNVMIVAADDDADFHRVACDYLSGMTDAFAMRMYKRLFDPGFGSIGDIT